MRIRRLIPGIAAAGVLAVASACNSSGSKQSAAPLPPDPQEAELAAGVEQHRAAYYRNLLTLHDFYAANGLETKRRWAAFELEGLGKVRTYAYAGTAASAPDDGGTDSGQ
ncbi:MAG: hypothetical protein FLDDKLPJ_01685 [Phycisphaerae bacterium]|nr:hypothetical protein [Phycisphaerae bacterium]